METGCNLHLLTLFDLSFNTLKLISAIQKINNLVTTWLLIFMIFFAEKK